LIYWNQLSCPYKSCRYCVPPRCIPQWKSVTGVSSSFFSEMGISLNVFPRMRHQCSLSDIHWWIMLRRLNLCIREAKIAVEIHHYGLKLNVNESIFIITAGEVHKLNQSLMKTMKRAFPFSYYITSYITYWSTLRPWNWDTPFGFQSNVLDILPNFLNSDSDDLSHVQSISVQSISHSNEHNRVGY
jgi:hypothetical protein